MSKLAKAQGAELVLELRAAEGGEDARLFCAQLADAYLRLCDRAG